MRVEGGYISFKQHTLKVPGRGTTNAVILRAVLCFGWIERNNYEQESGIVMERH
jgi:hypothetical protein